MIFKEDEVGRVGLSPVGGNDAGGDGTAVLQKQASARPETAPGRGAVPEKDLL